MAERAEIVRRRDPVPVTVDQIAIWEAQAARLADSSMVRGGYRGRPDNIIAAAMIGAELGWGLMFSLQHIHAWSSPTRRKVWDPDTRTESWITEDEPTTAISAPAQLSLLIEAGHSYELLAYSADEISVAGSRWDRPDKSWAVTVSRSDPDLAHLVGRGVDGDADFERGRPMWKRHPRRMLWWAAVRELVAVMCPEVVMGMTAAPDDAPDYSPADAPAAVAAAEPESLSLPAAPPAAGEGLDVRAPGPAPAAPERSPKARAKDAVLAACGGDAAAARECWEAMVARSPWPAYRDPGAWAADWMRLRTAAEAAEQPDPEPEPDPEPDPEPEPEPDALCDYRGRDGRRCVRAAHDSANHRLEPADRSRVGRGPGSRVEGSVGGLEAAPDAGETRDWRDDPAGAADRHAAAADAALGDDPAGEPPERLL